MENVFHYGTEAHFGHFLLELWLFKVRLGCQKTRLYCLHSQVVYSALKQRNSEKFRNVQSISERNRNWQTETEIVRIRQKITQHFLSKLVDSCPKLTQRHIPPKKPSPLFSCHSPQRKPLSPGNISPPQFKIHLKTHFSVIWTFFLKLHFKTLDLNVVKSLFFKFTSQKLRGNLMIETL